MDIACMDKKSYSGHVKIATDLEGSVLDIITMLSRYWSLPASLSALDIVYLDRMDKY